MLRFPRSEAELKLQTAYTPPAVQCLEGKHGKRRISMLTFSVFFSLKGTALKGIVLLDARGKHYEQIAAHCSADSVRQIYF